MACLRENLVVQTAAEFCEVAKMKCPKVTSIYRSVDILYNERQEEYLNIWTGAKDCSRIFSATARCVKTVGPYMDIYWETPNIRNLQPQVMDRDEVPEEVIEAEIPEEAFEAEVPQVVVY